MKYAVLTTVVLAVFLSGTANALVTKTFDDVKAEVEVRLADLPLENLTKDEKKEQKTLTKVLKLFDKESTTSKKDAKLIKSIVKLLAKQYPLDEDFMDLLRSSMDAFLDEANANLTHYKRGNEVLDDSNGKKGAAVKAEVKSDEALQLAYAENDPKTKATLLKKCEKLVGSAGKKTDKALDNEDLTQHQEAFLRTIQGGYKNANDCISCHTTAGTEMLAAGHWKWEGTTANVEGHEAHTHGKKDLLNNFCIAIPSNEGRCTQCHPGIGWKDDTFDFSDTAAIDCLVCHDTTGTYSKEPKTAGAPPASLDLTKIAMNAGRPGRANCGACHFNAGGGDNVKKGDLGSSLLSPTKAMDVHMGTDGQNFSCQQCHATTQHKIPGNGLQDAGRVSCKDCHTGTVHTGNATIEGHTGVVACQTCHIKTFSRQMPTKVFWDWSKAGQDISPIPTDEYGKPTYDKMKGEFAWEQDVTPELRWFNGKWKRMFIGENDAWTSLPVVLAEPVGSKGDGMIYPFKKMEGVQAADLNNQTMLVPHLFGLAGGPNPYWVQYDWDLAFVDGAAYTGQTYTRAYEWVPTVMYLAINHEVAPKEQARACTDCHNGGIDFKALGYTDDPILGGE